LEVMSTGQSMPSNGVVVLRPRYTSPWGLQNFGSNNPVKFEFQVAPALANGELDSASILPSVNTWLTDLGALASHPSNGDFRYLRFRVTFDNGSMQWPFGMSLEFLKLPFRF
jgi:hypothetical protein